jgi:hypothetical protein
LKASLQASFSVRVISGGGRFEDIARGYTLRVLPAVFWFSGVIAISNVWVSQSIVVTFLRLFFFGISIKRSLEARRASV